MVFFFLLLITLLAKFRRTFSGYFLVQFPQNGELYSMNSTVTPFVAKKKCVWGLMTRGTPERFVSCGWIIGGFYIKKYLF